jgi:hypothetical protein
MKRQNILIAMSLFFPIAAINGCISTISQQALNQIEIRHENARQAEKDQAVLIFKNAPMVEIVGKITEVHKNTNDIYEICRAESEVPRYLYLACRTYAESNMPIIARMELAVADHLASTGDFKAAKESYRDIIIKYPGGYYRPITKRAEFGLEDLKTK